MKNVFVFIALLSPLSLLAEGFEQTAQINSEFNRANHPSIFFENYDTNYSASGNAYLLGEKLPWSDSYWPRAEGGIAFRWQTDERINRAELPVGRSLNRAERKLLSPAEKFDLFLGDNKFNFSQNVLSENPDHAPGWQGICDGWAEAAIHFPSARPKTLRAPNGELIDFGASDIQALLSYHQAKIKKGKVRFLSKRCRRRWWGTRGCEGMNPGAFHIALLESLKRNQSFVVDIDMGEEVWNQPVVGYSYKSLMQRRASADSAEGAEREVLIDLELNYAHEIGPQWEYRPRPLVYDLKLRYWLELDKDDQIIGGSWHDEQAQRIDFAWYREKGVLPESFKKLLN